MDASDVLKKWLQYAEYDPEENSFNLLSLHYAFHRCCDTIRDFLKYDPTAELSVLYAKQFFKAKLADTSVKVADIFSDPNALAEEAEMWRLFHSPEVLAIEERVLDSFDTLLNQVIPVKQLGERNKDAERSALLGAVDAVANSLNKCNVDLFLRGGKIGRITNFSTHIHVFATLADCLLALEAASDGLYLCYIQCGDGADGYFGFFMKSNGTILSVNERINEAYPGEHGRRRNARWSDGKQYELFPYNYIFSFQEHDYKGVATKHIINTEKLAFFHLSPNAYMPLIMGMLLLSNRYAEEDLGDMPVKFVDSLLPVNLSLPTPGTQALIVPGDSQIAQVNRELDLHLDTNDVLVGTYNHLLCRPKSPDQIWDIYDYAWNEEDIFIQLYGQDFQLDASALLEANRHLKKLTASELATTKETPHAEFVGDRQRMTTIAYMNARTQLAEHIRDRMFTKYLEAGGTPGIKDWWHKTLLANKDQIFRLCVERYRKGEEYNWTSAKEEGIPMVTMALNTKDRPLDGNHSNYYPLNACPLTRSGYPDYGKALCCITGQAATIHFRFHLETWKDIAWLIGEENIPDILKGYKRRGHHGYGNSILDATDPMTAVGTPFEDEEIRKNRRLWTKSRWENYYFYSHDPEWPFKKAPDTVLPYSSEMDFLFGISFSKRGFAKLIKEAA